MVIADLYRCRWQVELFFKWIKQHLRIKSFYGNSENALKTQVWIAVSVYVLLVIIKRELKLEGLSINQVQQIASVTVLNKHHFFKLRKSESSEFQASQLLSNDAYSTYSRTVLT